MDVSYHEVQNRNEQIIYFNMIISGYFRVHVYEEQPTERLEKITIVIMVLHLHKVKVFNGFFEFYSKIVSKCQLVYQYYYVFSQLELYRFRKTQINF